MIKKIYILFFAAMLITACSDDIFSGQGSSDAVEMTGINASVESGVSSRSTDVLYLEDRISRYQFVSGDVMTFTKIQRTDNPITRFQYKDVAFSNNASGAWERDKNTGGSVESPDVHPERIYWSDATSPHTFVGYSLPKGNNSFDWKKSAYYYDKDGQKYEYDTYYGAIGNPLEATETIDYNPSQPATETITTTVNGKEESVTFGYSQKLRDEDLLLTYDNALAADNSVANIKFYHALSSVRIIVNISGFYGTEADAYSKVSNMILHNQPTLYRWKQQSTAVDALLTSNEDATLRQETLWGTSAPAFNQRKDMRLWNTNPNGDGEGASKTFTFYGITVPQDEGYFTTFTTEYYEKLNMTFKVTYPDPLKNDPLNKTITKSYSASLNNPVYFYPGKCTTINITLNHKDETMTVGASYQDWEYVETPDEGALKKKSTFLTSIDRNNVTIVGDAKATADDATWLYNAAPEGETPRIVDIYGNDGTATKPYTISTANQLLSFAYEVNNGRSFAGQFVKLDADITMQSTSSMPTKTVNDVEVPDYSKLISWIGIGNETYNFEGFFLGNNRHINNLFGKPFFTKIGKNAVVDKIDFANVIRVNGSGVIADTNTGLLCACTIDGDIEQASGGEGTYCGSFVGDNQSFIIACTHNGTVSGYGYVGGLVGRNAGTIIASYHTGLVKFATGASDPDENNKTDGWNVGGSSGYKAENAQIFSCYFNGDLIAHTPATDAGKVAYPLTTSQMQANAFVNHTSLGENKYYDIISKQEVTIDLTDETDLCKKRLCLNDALKVFGQWLESKPTEGTIKTNTRDFTGQQIQFLKDHYSSAHTYKYTPGAYPKVQ